MNRQLSIYTEVGKEGSEPNFYQMMDKEATKKAGKDLMAAYQRKRKAGQKRVTPYTHDLFHAIIRSVAPTMEDIKRNQEGLYDECRTHGEYFCFTTIPSLITLLNDTAHHQILSPKTKTVYNQIKLLLEIGIITEKVNYVCTGKRNPYPHEESPRGRGKIQLWISPQVLCIKPYYEASAVSDRASFFEENRKTLPQYSTSTLLYRNKELESIINTPAVVDKAALAVAKSNGSDIHDEGRKNKSMKPKAQRFEGQNFTKKEHECEKIWELLRFHLYQNNLFNEQINIESRALIGDWLNVAAEHVRGYRKTKIASFMQNPAYLASKRQNSLLKKFTATLPKVERAAIEIISHAVIKQKKHAERYAYQVYQPVNYLTSQAAEKAVHYSIADWDRIQAQYFDKNKASKAYFEQVQWINQRHSAAIEQIQTEGIKKTYETTTKQYNKWWQALKQDPYLDEHKIQKLSALFIDKFKPLLNEQHLKQRQANG